MSKQHVAFNRLSDEGTARMLEGFISRRERSIFERIFGGYPKHVVISALASAYSEGYDRGYWADKTERGSPPTACPESSDGSLDPVDRAEQADPVKPLRTSRRRRPAKKINIPANQ